MKIVSFVLLCLVLIISGCSAFSPEPTAINILTSTPLQTPTPINIATLYLDEILINDGDLPAGYRPSQISYGGIPFLGSDNDLAVNWIKQEVEYKNEDIGTITLGLSSSKDESQKLFDLLVDSLGNEESTENGVTSKLGSSTTTNRTEIKYGTVEVDFSDLSKYIPNIKNVSLAFHKCYFTGYIINSDTSDPTGMINYVERLSRRLVELLNCK